MAGSNRSTALEKESRLQEIYQLVITGLPRQAILAYCAQHFDIKRAQADNYVRAIKKSIAEESKSIRKDALARHLAFRAYLKSEAMATGDLRLAFDIARDESKLLGLYPTIKVRNESIIFDVSNVDFDKLSDNQIKQLAEGKEPYLVLGNSGNDRIEDESDF